jgi:anthranilate phosphoribosyltransferase
MNTVNHSPLDIVKTLFAANSTLEQQVAGLRQLQINNLNGVELAQIVNFILQQSHLLPSVASNTIDLVGTGGDHSHSFNISTAASFVIAGSGIPVAKHGNRAITSRTGSFDCLQALNIQIADNSQTAFAQLQQHGLTFLFAPYFHPHLKIIKPARDILAKEGQKSVFNILGPLLNPARVSRIVIGVYDPQLLLPFAHALQILGVQKALVVHGAGMDEASIFAETDFVRLDNNKIEQGVLEAQDYQLASADQTAIKGGDAQENAEKIIQILQNQLFGAARDMVIFNAALAIVIALDQLSLPDAIALATDSINSGRALAKLRALQGATA